MAIDGRLNLSIPQIQGYLQQLLLDSTELSSEQRYSIKSAIEMFGIIQQLAPGIAAANKSREADEPTI